MAMMDRNGFQLREGEAVRLVRADPALLRGLPEEDQQAIQWATREAELILVGRDGSTGNVELEFQDPGGTMHWISVSPEDVAVVRR
jgi:hypothetical protein